ncbi:hypothetical protein F7725_016636 [Dissostichus mawsoni]|uniref:Tubulin monoglycylase TTLL3-like n=1 Tax=Dissostichus mawsoni TaxID=36200 RepID=A0A7J5Z315_DISMA|nr:hypothetical protein F7725_016636 [Dissostichus mawsoni]
MKTTKSKQPFHLATDRRYTTCPDSGRETEGLSKDQKVTAFIQKYTQDEGKGLQASTPPEGKVPRSFVSLPVLNPDRLKTARALVDKAVRMHKVFSVQGPYPVIRTALRARGWVEQRLHCPKPPVHHRHSEEGSPKDSADSDEDDDNVNKEPDPDGIYDIMSRLVRNEMVYFYWTMRRDAINPNSLQKEQIINHFAKAGSFTTKDYRRTACTSFLKYIVEREEGVQTEGTSHNTRAARKRSKQRSRPMDLSKMITSALKVCQEFLESLEHRDIDRNLETPLTEEQWEEFIHSYQLIENSDIFVHCCKAMLERLVEVSPQLDIDGIHNIWIIKPGAMSRGRGEKSDTIEQFTQNVTESWLICQTSLPGIKCAKHLDQILQLVDGDSTLIKESKWVVQKYLERPLLVHGTKFDLRQWFLVTDWNPLTVWFYKKCYVRFSTQPYSLNTMDNSVHLCNNSIQKHLIPSQQRHHGIPADNMWSDDQFRTFLCSQGRGAQWQTVVVPGMKKAVIHALQTTQDLMESRKNTFELYGADFMLGHDLRPWLIELNASPTMAHSTPVTARLCSAVQEDTIRVVLDRRADRTANTGDFQLIYKQAAVDVPQYVGVNLLVEGNKIRSPCTLPPLNRPGLKRRSRENEPVVEKVKPLPKMLLKSQFKNIISVISTPPRTTLPPDPPLPMTVRTIQLPANIQSRSVLLWKRKRVVQKVCSQKVQPCTLKNGRGLSLSLEIIAKQPRQTATSSSSA